MAINRVKYRNNKIELRKRWPDGSEYRRFFPNRTQAKNMLTRIENSILEGTWRDFREELRRGPALQAAADSVTVQSFSAQFLERSKISAPKSWSRYALSFESLNQHLGDIEMRAFRRQDLYRYVELRAREVSPGTVNRDVACIKSMFSHAVEVGKIEAHPLVRFPMLPVDEISRPLLTVEEFRRLVESMDRLPLAAMTALMGETALRRGEALQLKWDRINLRDEVIGLQHTKNGRVRHVPLSDYAIEWLQQLVRYVNCPYVFVNPRTGKRWKSPEKAFQRGREGAKLTWVGFHDLRRFRAVQWVRLGLDVETVRKLLGHRDIQTTQLYIKGLEPYLDDVRAIQATEYKRVSSG